MPCFNNIEPDSGLNRITSASIVFLAVCVHDSLVSAGHEIEQVVGCSDVFLVERLQVLLHAFADDDAIELDAGVAVLASAWNIVTCRPALAAGYLAGTRGILAFSITEAACSNEVPADSDRQHQTSTHNTHTHTPSMNGF
eukprot:3282601-Rhodomonas_salina.1